MYLLLSKKAISNYYINQRSRNVSDRFRVLTEVSSIRYDQKVIFCLYCLRSPDLRVVSKLVNPEKLFLVFGSI